MLFDGDAIKVHDLGEGLIELCFERKGESVNKLDRLAFGELRGALEILAKTPDLKGVLVTSAKDVFIVGADIFEFVEPVPAGAGGHRRFRRRQRGDHHRA